MDKSKKLIAGVIATLSIVATTSIATPAYAYTGADLANISKVQTMNEYTGKTANSDYVIRGTTKVYSGATTNNATSSANNATTQKTQITKTRQATAEELNGKWLIRSNGIATFWAYHLSDGSPYTGWLKYNGSWYYLKYDSMLTNRYVEGEYIGADGALTTPPATFNYNGGNLKYRTITPQDVKATKEMRERLLKDGWVQDFLGAYWTGDEATVYLPPDKDGTPYSTTCNIVAGVATVTVLTDYGYRDFNNHKQWKDRSSYSIKLPLEEYLEYKKEGKIGKFEVYWTVNGVNLEPEYNEYLQGSLK